MGMLFKAYLSGPKIWSCERCAAHLASHDDIISKVRCVLCLVQARPCNSFVSALDAIRYSRCATERLTARIYD
jgi:hypothetical protein